MHRNKRRVYCVMIYIYLSLFLGAISCRHTKKGDTVSERIYATVNGSNLTESELQTLVPIEYYNKMTTQQKTEVVKEWVNRELLYQEALQNGLDKDPVIAKVLKKSSQNLLSNELLERKLTGIKAPSEDELKNYYDTHRTYFRVQGNEFKVRYALFDNIKEARDFWKQVKSGGSFSEIAHLQSKDESAKLDGDLGIVNEDSVEPEVWAAIRTTISTYGVGKISDPFSVVDGWGVIIVDKVYEEGTVKPYDIVREQVLDFYMSEKRDEVRKLLLDELSKKASITYHFNGL